MQQMDTMAGRVDLPGPPGCATCYEAQAYAGEAIFDVALRDMMADSTVVPSVEELWRRFVTHLRRAVEVTREGIDFHLEHMHEVFPELVLDLPSPTQK